VLDGFAGVGVALYPKARQQADAARAGFGEGMAAAAGDGDDGGGIASLGG
jgi:hypothetical protein